MSWYYRRKRQYWAKKNGIRFRVYYDPKQKFYGYKCKLCNHVEFQHTPYCVHWYPKRRRVCYCNEFIRKERFGWTEKRKQAFEESEKKRLLRLN